MTVNAANEHLLGNISRIVKIDYENSTLLIIVNCLVELNLEIVLSSLLNPIKPQRITTKINFGIIRKSYKLSA